MQPPIQACQDFRGFVRGLGERAQRTIRNCHGPSSATVPRPNPSITKGAPAIGSAACRAVAERAKNSTKGANLMHHTLEHRCRIVFALPAYRNKVVPSAAGMGGCAETFPTLPRVSQSRSIGQLALLLGE